MKGSVLIWLCILVFLWSATFLPPSILHGMAAEGVKLPHIAEGSLSFPVKNIFVFDKATQSDKETAILDFRSNPVCVSKAPVHMLFKRRGIGSDYTWQSVEGKHNHVARFWFANNIQGEMVGSAFGFGDIGGSTPMDIDRELQYSTTQYGWCSVEGMHLDYESSPLLADKHLNVFVSGLGGFLRRFGIQLGEVSVLVCGLSGVSSRSGIGLGGLGIRLRGLGGFSSNLGRGTTGLLRIFSEAFSRAPKKTSVNSQTQGDDCESYGRVSNQFFIKRLVIFVFSLCLCLYVSSLSGKYFYDARRFLGAALVVIATLIGLAGLTLFLLTASCRTWGWIL